MKGRPIRGAITGVLFGLFLGLDLFMFGVVPLDSPLITITTVLGLVGGIVLGVAAPFGGGSRGAAPPA